MSVRLELSDVVIKDFSDTEKNYSVFQGTFSDAMDMTMYELTLHTNKGNIEIKSGEVSYSNPYGLTNYGEVLRYFLDVATNNPKEESIVDILDYLLWSCTENGTYLLKVADHKQEFCILDWSESDNFSKTTKSDIKVFLQKAGVLNG